MVEVRQVVACVSVPQATAMWVEHAIEAGYEHVLRDAGKQRLVDPREYLPRRKGVRPLSGELQHAAGGGHHQGCRHALARRVSHHKSQPAFREEVEVVEVTSYLSGWLVEGGDVPSLQGGHILGQGGLLNASGHLKLLLYALALALYLCEALLLQGCDGACPLPLLGYLAPFYAVDIDDLVR